MQCAVDPTITSELSEDDSGYEYEYDEHETEVGITSDSFLEPVWIQGNVFCFGI